MNTLTFTAPSGHTYTIREQNGQDEEILTNVADVKNIMNITKFIQAIIIGTSRKPDAKSMTIEEILNLPILDRYCIIFQARIFSIGNMMDIEYKWKKDDGTSEKLEFEQDLEEFLLPYDKIMAEEISPSELETILNEKPDAIPMYPMQGQEKGIEITLNSGKNIKFDLLDGHGERFAVKLTDDKATRNAEFLARNLHLEVDGKWDRVQNFSLFTRKEMMEMRNKIHALDPSFSGTTTLTHPVTGESVKYPILASSAFFFPEDVE